MAVREILTNCSFSIEVQKGTDKDGEPTYSKKTFSNLNSEITPENLFEVSKAIKEVFANECGDSFRNNTSKLVNA